MKTIEAPRAVEPKMIAHNRTVIGSAMTLVGDVTGDEDLLVDGTIRGHVTLPGNTVTIGKSGRVKAAVVGRTVHVEGEVEGDVFGSEQVVLHRSAQVRGNISSPRVVIEDGARLKGSIDTSVEKGQTVLLSSDRGESDHNVDASVEVTDLN